MISIILTSNCDYDEFESAAARLNMWLDDKFAYSCSLGNMYFDIHTNGIALAYFSDMNYLGDFIAHVKMLDWSQESWVQLIISKGAPFEIINIRSNDNVST